MNSNNQLITDYAILAETSYANFKELNNKVIISAIMNVDSKTGEAERPESFAKYVTDRYNVIAHYADRVEQSYDFSTGNTVVDTAANAWATPAIPISIGAGVILKKAYDKESGFSATLFQAKGNAENANEYVLAIRGTAGFKDVSASVGWVLAPTRFNITNNVPIFQAA